MCVCIEMVLAQQNLDNALLTKKIYILAGKLKLVDSATFERLRRHVSTRKNARKPIKIQGKPNNQQKGERSKISKITRLVGI